MKALVRETDLIAFCMPDTDLNARLIAVNETDIKSCTLQDYVSESKMCSILGGEQVCGEKQSREK